jgi:L-galactose dehydrogenase
MAALPETFVRGFHNLDVISRMPYRKLGKAGRLVSALSFGASSFGGSFSQFPEELCKPLLEAALRG